MTRLESDHLPTFLLTYRISLPIARTSLPGSSCLTLESVTTMTKLESEDRPTYILTYRTSLPIARTSLPGSSCFIFGVGDDDDEVRIGTTYVPTVPTFTYRPSLTTDRPYLAARKLVLDVGVGDDDDKVRVGQGYSLGFLAAAVQEHRVTFFVCFQVLRGRRTNKHEVESCVVWFEDDARLVGEVAVRKEASRRNSVTVPELR